jgi:hypothetical protein
VVDVDSDVEFTVIPVGLVVAAPLPIRLEFIDVAIDLPAMLSVFRGISIDPGLIGVETPMAIVPVIMVGKSHLRRRERESYG